MIEFYYDLLDHYVAREDFELIEMDMDSNYLAISVDSQEEIVKPECWEQFEASKKHWLAWNIWSNRTAGIFKLEYEGPQDMGCGLELTFIEDKYKLAVRTLKHEAFLSDTGELVHWCAIELLNDDMVMREWRVSGIVIEVFQSAHDSILKTISQGGAP